MFSFQIKYYTFLIECRNELMRVGKIIDELIEPVLKAAEHKIGHGLTKYPDPPTCKDKSKTLKVLKSVGLLAVRAYWTLHLS